MRVAFVSMETAFHEETPATARTRRTARLLAARGHEVTVCCARWWDGEVAAFDREGVTYRAVTAERAPGRFATRLPFALRKLRPDVVHAVETPPKHVLAAKTAARFLRTPVVVDWWGGRTGSGSASRRAASAPDAVCVPSRTVATEVREYGAAESAVRVVPEGIDLDRVRAAPVDRRADVVYSRDLDEHANVEAFLLALAELRDRDWRAAVVGDGPARADAERTARDLRIDDRVAFLGALPDDERVSVFKGAHVFAQTAARESFARDLLCALACGCVGVVEYQAGSSAHELVEGSERHSLVTSPQELAAEIAAAAGKPRLTVADGYEGYDHDAVVERYVECYRDVGANAGWF